MRKLSTPLLPLLLFFFLSLPLPTSQQSFVGDPGFGCSTCLLLDNPKELVPCSDAWRQLMNICSSPKCTADYGKYVSKSPPVASCTNTPNPLPGGTASAGFSFGSWVTVSRGTPTGTKFKSADRTTPGSKSTKTGSRDGPSSTTTGPNGAATSGGGGDGGGSGSAGGEPTPTPAGAGSGTNSGIATATGGVGRVVAGGLGVGWLWEAVFVFWGAVW